MVIDISVSIIDKSIFVYIKRLMIIINQIWLTSRVLDQAN